MKIFFLCLVSVLKSQKNYFCPLLILLFLSIFITSCKEESVPTKAHENQILTDETIAQLQSAADKIMMESQTPGLVAYVAVEGEGELYISRGVGNLNTDEPINTNDYFRLASVTKTFTTEAALILVDENKIDLNKTISFYLPELNIPGKDTITIRMLGNMTSGLLDCLNNPVLATAYYSSEGTIKFTPEELMVPMENTQLQFKPGTQYNYSNTNTILLGMVIKKVAGKELKEVLAEKIFQPLGLTHTFWPETNYLPQPYHHAYTSNLRTKHQDVTYWGNSWGNAAGILISNIADLKIWAKELFERKLLSTSSKNERFQQGVTGSEYAFGLEYIGDWLGHQGGINGWNNMVFFNPLKKITVIIHANSSDGLPAGFAFQEFGRILSTK